MNKESLSILGGGLIGSLWAIYLRKLGYPVQVFDKRPDTSQAKEIEGGRSINMALSFRGLKSLEKVGLKDKILPLAIPMYGREVHDEQGNTQFMPYGQANQAIYSISRGKFNLLLSEEASRLGATFHFRHKFKSIDFASSQLTFETPTGLQKTEGGIVFGADGAYSALRLAMQKQARFNLTQEYISHGYKELSIPPLANGDFALSPNALHIWPRGSFMLIALPNPDHSFTCTLFLPFDGEGQSFSQLHDEKSLLQFFQTYFKDALPLMPQLTQEFFTNPTSSLINISCYPWAKGKSLLLGDASHAMVPFYGQGMNSGFEDCFELHAAIEGAKPDQWELIFQEFQETRKPNTDAMCTLAMENFVEMRDHVADPRFVLRKKIESLLHEAYPTRWVPLYTMVTFSDLPYREAYRRGKLQEKVMDEVMADPLIVQNWKQLHLEGILTKLQQLDRSR